MYEKVAATFIANFLLLFKCYPLIKKELVLDKKQLTNVNCFNAILIIISLGYNI